MRPRNTLLAVFTSIFSLVVVAGSLLGLRPPAPAPMVTALAAQSGTPVAWMAAVQATVSTNLTMLSPMRVAMGIAFDGGQTSEAALYRVARVLALPSVLAGLAAVALLVWARP